MSILEIYMRTHTHRTRGRGKKFRFGSGRFYYCSCVENAGSISPSSDTLYEQSFGGRKRKRKSKQTEKKNVARKEREIVKPLWVCTQASASGSTNTVSDNERTKPHDEWKHIRSNLKLAKWNAAAKDVCAVLCAVLCYMRCGMVWVFTYRHHTKIFLNLALVFLFMSAIRLQFRSFHFFSVLFFLCLIFFKSSSLLLSLASCKTKARQKKTKYWQASERGRERQKKLKSTNGCRIFHAVKRVY